MPEAVSTSLVGSGSSGRVKVKLAAGSETNAVFIDLFLPAVRQVLIFSRVGVGMGVPPPAHAVSGVQHPSTTHGDFKAL